MDKYTDEDINDILKELDDLADADAYNDYQQGFTKGLLEAIKVVNKHTINK